MEFDYIFKYIVIGNSGVGKSCIVNRFIQDEYSDEIESTIGVEFGAKVVKLDIDGK
jgi:GTPase SAR1 family protein